MTYGSKTLRRWLGWCPNHPSGSASPPATKNGIYLFAVVCILVIPAATLLVLSPASQSVAVWAFHVDETGTRHFTARLPATEDSTGKISLSGALEAGTYWLVIEHPSRDGRYRLALDGDYVKRPPADPAAQGMILFKIGGPGSLQQEDAYQALLASFDDGRDPGSGTNPGPGNEGYVTEREYVIKP